MDVNKRTGDVDLTDAGLPQGETMEHQNALAGAGIVVFVLAFLPSVVALLRGKIIVCVVLTIALILNLLLALTVVGLPIAALVWFALLIVGLVAGGGKTVVVVQQQTGAMTPARPAPRSTAQVLLIVGEAAAPTGRRVWPPRRDLPAARVRWA
jgi:hypothetical protein